MQKSPDTEAANASVPGDFWRSTHSRTNESAYKKYSVNNCA